MVSCGAHDRIVFDLCEVHARAVTHYSPLFIRRANRYIGHAKLLSFQVLRGKLDNQDCPGRDLLQPSESVHLRKETLGQLLQRGINVPMSFFFVFLLLFLN